MKIKYILFAIIIITGIWTSCVEDPGNYDYKTKEELLPVEITSLESSYVILQAEKLAITPEFIKMDNENRYSYLWYTISQSGGQIPVRDTLAQTKDLDVVVKLKAGTYKLYFEVRDLQLDIYINATSSLEVTQSNITGGWFILKDENDETDFDYINLKGEMTKNVLQNISIDKQLKGKAKKIIYQSSRYYHQQVNEDGTVTLLTNQRAYHIVSDKEYKTFNAANLSIFKEYEEQFYSFPGAGIADVGYDGSSNLYTINTNKIYSIYGYSSNVGKYGLEKLIGTSSDYSLYGEMVTNDGNAMVFDNKSKSFLYTSGSGTSLNYFKDKDGEVSLKNMKSNIKALLPRKIALSTTAFAIVENLNTTTDTGKYSLLSISFNFSNTSEYPVTQIDTIPNKYQMPTAKVLAAPLVSSCIYFSNDNKLNVYITAGDNRESVLKNFPADETISCIKNVNGKMNGETVNKNYLAVTTNSNRGWKLYLFEIIGVTPEIDPEPVHVIEGEGNARYIMYRAS